MPKRSDSGFSAEDRARSPHSGWTRAHWLAVAERLLGGYLRHVDPVTGVPDFPEAGMEAGLRAVLRAPGGLAERFSRPLILAALWMSGSGRTTLDGVDVAACFRSGLARFADPERSPDRRPGEAAAYAKAPQRIAIGTALAVLACPRQFVDELDAGTRAHVVGALQSLAERRSQEQNFLLFELSAATALDRFGASYHREAQDGRLDTILSMYRGDGWFIDGWNRQFDGYNFWAFQFYLHLLLHVDERWRQRYGERLREITRLHEASVPFYFGADGAPIPKGRSLTYRFAHGAGIAAAQLSGLNAMPPGLARRIASGCLKYFWERGCQDQDGLLAIGYHGRNGVVGENYTDLGAPYWAVVGLLPLLLPAEHPFWVDQEQPMPAEQPGLRRCALPGAQMVLQTDGARGEARMHVVGEPFFHRRVWQAGSKFFQHAISSTLGYALAGEGQGELAQNRSGISDDGEHWSYRTWPQALHVAADHALSRWDAWTGGEGQTGTVYTEHRFLDRGELHLLWHESDGPRYLRIGGYALQLAHDEDVEQVVLDEQRVLLCSRAVWSSLRCVAGEGSIRVERLRPRPGFRHAHLFDGWSAFPVWTSREPVPAGSVIGIHVDACRREREHLPGEDAALEGELAALVQARARLIQASTARARSTGT